MSEFVSESKRLSDRVGGGEKENPQISEKERAKILAQTTTPIYIYVFLYLYIHIHTHQSTLPLPPPPSQTHIGKKLTLASIKV